MRAWLSQRILPSRTALSGGLFLFLLLLPVWWTATHWYGDLLLTEQRAEVLETVSAHGNALTSAMNRRLARLQGLSAFVHAEMGNPALGAKFEPFVARLLEGSSAVRYLAVAPGGIVQYVYPAGSDEIQVGSEVKIDKTLSDTQSSRLVKLTNPLSLASGEIGVMAWQTLHADGQVWGLVTMAISLKPLLAESGVDVVGDQLQLALRDDEGRVFFGNEAIFTDTPVIAPITLPDGTWFLAGIPAAGWAASVERPFRVFQGVSFLVLLLLVILTTTVANRQAQLTRAVADRTRDLLTAQQDLEKRVAERTHQLTALLAVSADITSELALLPLLRLILDQLQNTVDYTAAAIMELEADELVQIAFRGPHTQEEVVGRRLPIGKLDMIWESLAAHRPCIIHNLWDETPMARAMRQVVDERLLYPGAGSHACLGVPLQLKDRIVGVLVLHHDQPGYFTEERVQLVMTFANQAAIAIENAHLYEQAQELAGLRERQRLARDLHDSVSQVLYGISLGARTARMLLDRNPSGLAEPLDYILSLAKTGLSEMRALIFELRPESLEREGLVVALGKQAAAFRDRHQLDIVTDFGDEPAISLETKDAFYRIAQEALNNTVKHAQATRIQVNLSCSDGSLVLAIDDDGQGFDTAKDYPGHLGLRSMEERSERVGGTFAVDSTPGRGTTVRVAVPYDAE